MITLIVTREESKGDGRLSSPRIVSDPTATNGCDTTESRPSFPTSPSALPSHPLPSHSQPLHSTSNSPFPPASPRSLPPPPLPAVLLRPTSRPRLVHLHPSILVLSAPALSSIVHPGAQSVFTSLHPSLWNRDPHRDPYPLPSSTYLALYFAFLEHYLPTITTSTPLLAPIGWYDISI